VVQLETAMGAAVGVFEGAAAIRVPRARFAPVKKTDDLLVVRSDAYELAEDFTVRLARERAPAVSLDSDCFKLLRDFEQRFSGGVPSLVDCERLTVEGDVSFGRDVKVRGEVILRGPRRVEDGELLEG
jgi:UTP--glucose-1-phosphate uridylyltransferase